MRAVAITLLALGAAAGCASGNKQVQTQRYTLSHPDYWRVKRTATKDGDPTVVVIPQYGDAVIDEGSGAMEPRGSNYEAVTADVEVRIYAWHDPGTTEDPTPEVARLLGRDEELKLSRHMVIGEHPPECDVLPKKYIVFGQTQQPIDLVSRPGFRTIVVGGRASGVLVGTVARVEYEQDMGRYCHNLSNLRVQLQNLLDGLQPVPGGGGPPTGAKPPAAPAAPPAEAPAPAPAPAPPGPQP
jgi:hypothetical protein